MKKITGLISLTVLFAMLTGCTAAGSSDDPAVSVDTGNVQKDLVVGKNSINLPMYRQARSTWCWAAVDLMVVRYFHPNSKLTQSEIVRQTVGEVRDTPEGISTGVFWSDNKIHYSLIQGKISYECVKYYIDNGEPVEVDLKWKSQGGGGHSLLIYGYYIAEYPENRISRKFVMYVDPSDGKAKYSEYDYLADNGSFWKFTRCDIYSY
jgi:hypothetical protein